MRRREFSTLLVSILSFFILSVHSIYIFSSPGAIPTTVPAACRAVLSQNITCEPSLVRANEVAQGRTLGEANAELYCTPACYKSLSTFKTNVAARCGNTLYKFYANSSLEQSGNQIASPFVWAYNVTCLQDSSGFCLQSLYAGNKTACSECSLKYQALMLSSDYGRARIDAEDFSSVLSSCSVPASSYTYTYSPLPTPTSATSTTPEPTVTPRCEGGEHTVTSSDSCESVAKAKGMAIDRLIVNNNLDYNCTNLKAGTKLCLEKPCKLHTVLEGETCHDMYAGTDFGLNMLVSWNPTIHRNCDNFDTFVGRSICVSPPGTLEFEATPLNITTTSFSSLITGSWEGGPVDPTPTVSFNTTWYTSSNTYVIPTTTISVNQTKESLLEERLIYCWITPEDYEAGFEIDMLPKGCIALFEKFCDPSPDAPVPASTRIPSVCTPTLTPVEEVEAQAFAPAGGSNGFAALAAASTKSTATALTTLSRTSSGTAMPTPLLEGMRSSCKKFFLVKHDGESCLSIIRHWKLSEDKFLDWNPALGKDCAGLKIGYYVCIGV